MNTTRLSLVIDEVRTARDYTRSLIVDTPESAWFTIPPAGISHVAWQVGHLAMATYRLALERVRGHRDSDDAVISPAFLAQWGRASVPVPDASKYPPAAAILGVYDAVHELAMKELPTLTEADLDAPPTKPHPTFSNKYGSLTWHVRHTMLHAGQIGLLRRQLGAEPRW